MWLNVIVLVVRSENFLKVLCTDFKAIGYWLRYALALLFKNIGGLFQCWDYLRASVLKICLHLYDLWSSKLLDSQIFIDTQANVFISSNAYVLEYQFFVDLIAVMIWFSRIDRQKTSYFYVIESGRAKGMFRNSGFRKILCVFGMFFFIVVYSLHLYLIQANSNFRPNVQLFLVFSKILHTSAHVIDNLICALIINNSIQLWGSL